LILRNNHSATGTGVSDFAFGCVGAHRGRHRNRRLGRHGGRGRR
jgi:hypothetical protein